jgi:hypothetical protein
MTTSDVLEHFGIPGMRWHRRKSSGNVTSVKTTKPDKVDTTSDDHKKKVNLKSKKIHEMSNSELKSLTERMQLERNYKQLTDAETSKGGKVLKEILAKSAQQTATTYVTKYMGKGVEELIKKLSKQ